MMYRKRGGIEKKEAEQVGKEEAVSWEGGFISTLILECSEYVKCLGSLLAGVLGLMSVCCAGVGTGWSQVFGSSVWFPLWSFY